MNSVCFGANSIKHFRFLGLKWNDKYHVCLQFHKDDPTTTISNSSCSPALHLSQKSKAFDWSRALNAGFSLIIKEPGHYTCHDCHPGSLSIIHSTHTMITFVGHSDTAGAPKRTLSLCDPPRGSLPTTPSLGLDQREVSEKEEELRIHWSWGWLCWGRQHTSCGCIECAKGTSPKVPWAPHLNRGKCQCRYFSNFCHLAQIGGYLQCIYED